jgi:hypothetical protein
VRRSFIGVAVSALVVFALAGCSSPARGTLEGTAAACNGIYPINNQTLQNVGTLHLQVVVTTGKISDGPIVASQQLEGNLSNSFRPSYRLTVPSGTYRVVAASEVKSPWPLQVRWLQVKSGVTTRWDFGCTGDH